MMARPLGLHLFKNAESLDLNSETAQFLRKKKKIVSRNLNLFSKDTVIRMALLLEGAL
jgi:hypothetical protein